MKGLTASLGSGTPLSEGTLAALPAEPAAPPLALDPALLEPLPPLAELLEPPLPDVELFAPDDEPPPEAAPVFEVLLQPAPLREQQKIAAQTK
jgi:hypothetical protein